MKIMVFCSVKVFNCIDERKLSGVNIPDDCSTTGEVVEVGASNCDVGTLRRDLNKTREGIEEVAKLTVLNQKRLGCIQT